MRVLLIILIVVCVTNAWWSRRSSGSSSSSRSRSGSRSGSRWFRSSRSSSGGSKNHPHDMDKAGLKKLYNSKVVKVEHVKRPIGGILGKIPHTGVVATTSNGDRYLIHKGKDYGKDSSTVVVKADHMSNKWKTTETKDTSGKTISDLMKAGYVDKPYGFIGDKKICWEASKNIMDKATRQRRRRRRNC